MISFILFVVAVVFSSSQGRPGSSNDPAPCKLECFICFEDLSHGDIQHLMTTLSCGDAACTSCLQDYLMRALTDRSLKPRCACPGVEIPLKDYPPTIRAQLIQRRNDWEEERQALIAVNQQQTKHALAKDEALIAEFAPPCPQCRAFCEKDEACNHVTCSICNFEFCHACRRSWNGTYGASDRCGYGTMDGKECRRLARLYRENLAQATNLEAKKKALSVEEERLEKAQATRKQIQMHEKEYEDRLKKIREQNAINAAKEKEEIFYSRVQTTLWEAEMERQVTLPNHYAKLFKMIVEQVAHEDVEYRETFLKYSKDFSRDFLTALTTDCSQVEKDTCNKIFEAITTAGRKYMFYLMGCDDEECSEDRKREASKKLFYLASAMSDLVGGNDLSEEFEIVQNNIWYEAKSRNEEKLETYYGFSKGHCSKEEFKEKMVEFRNNNRVKLKTVR